MGEKEWRRKSDEDIPVYSGSGEDRKDDEDVIIKRISHHRVTQEMSRFQGIRK